MRARSSAASLVCIGLALALGVVGASAAGSAPSFAAARKYAGKTWPTLGTVADMNGDGALDLVTRNGLRGGGVSVFLNGGDSRRPRQLAPGHCLAARGDLARHRLATTYRGAVSCSPLSAPFDPPAALPSTSRRAW